MLWHSRLSLPILVLALAPATAGAATVAPGQSIQKAVDAAKDGDVIDIQGGTYREVVTTDKALTLRAAQGAVLVNPESVKSGPTLQFTGQGGDTVTGLVVVSTVGDAVQLGGGKSLVQRAGLLSLAKDASALSASASTQSSGETAATVDSSILVGARSLTAAYASPGTLGGKGIGVTLRHVTAIGDVVADAGTASPGSTGIAVGFLDSIVRGKRAVTAGQGGSAPAPPANPLPLPLPAPPASPLAATTAAITADVARNDVKDAATDLTSLFVSPSGFDYHLRADAADIDKGQVTSGESTTDIDGDPRSAGRASDYGADEFVNKAPTAVVTTTAPRVSQNIPVTFDASKSSDPEARSGGGISTYHWTFGDGTTADTTAPTVSHAFPEKKAYSVTVEVTDRQGLKSGQSAPVSFTVTDGTPPTLTVSQPTAGQAVTLYKKARKGKRARRAKVTFFGTAKDDTALGGVLLALRSSATSTGTCRWFDGRTKLVSAACTAPVVLKPTLVNGAWTYVLPSKARLKKGGYELIVLAFDTSGLTSPAQTVAFRFR